MILVKQIYFRHQHHTLHRLCNNQILIKIDGFKLAITGAVARKKIEERDRNVNKAAGTAYFQLVNITERLN